VHSVLNLMQYGERDFFPHADHNPLPCFPSQLALDPPAPLLPMPLESSDTRILNLSRNCRLKRHQAESKISAGVAIWVERGLSIRELTIAEVIAYRIERANDAETHPGGLAPSEVFGLVWQPPITNQRHYTETRNLLRQAREFAQLQT
jgi:hypothetical protein